MVLTTMDIYRTEDPHKNSEYEFQRVRTRLGRRNQALLERRNKVLPRFLLNATPIQPTPSLIEDDEYALYMPNPFIFTEDPDLTDPGILDECINMFGQRNGTDLLNEIAQILEDTENFSSYLLSYHDTADELSEAKQRLKNLEKATYGMYQRVIEKRHVLKKKIQDSLITINDLSSNTQRLSDGLIKLNADVKKYNDKINHYKEKISKSRGVDPQITALLQQSDSARSNMLKLKTELEHKKKDLSNSLKQFHEDQLKLKHQLELVEVQEETLSKQIQDLQGLENFLIELEGCNQQKISSQNQQQQKIDSAIRDAELKETKWQQRHSDIQTRQLKNTERIRILQQRKESNIKELVNILDSTGADGLACELEDSGQIPVMISMNLQNKCALLGLNGAFMRDRSKRTLIFDIDGVLIPKTCNLSRDELNKHSAYISTITKMDLDQTIDQTRQVIQFMEKCPGETQNYLDNHVYNNVDYGSLVQRNDELEALLNSLDHRKVIFTNSTEKRTIEILEALGIRKCFDSIVTTDHRIPDFSYLPQPTAIKLMKQLFQIGNRDNILYITGFADIAEFASSEGVTSVLNAANDESQSIVSVLTDTLRNHRLL